MAKGDTVGYQLRHPDHFKGRWYPQIYGSLPPALGPQWEARELIEGRLFTHDDMKEKKDE